MRNKYKNLQNRGQSQKGSSFVITEKRNQVIVDNNINYIHKNSFISNIDGKGRGEKILNKTNDKDQKQLPSSRLNIEEKSMDLGISKRKNSNTIKTSNHNILISVYTKDSSIKGDSIISNNTTTNRNYVIKHNNNKNDSINTNITNMTNMTNNNSISRNSNYNIDNSNRIFNSKRNHKNQIIVEQDKKQNSLQYLNMKKQFKNQPEKRQLDIIDIKNTKNKDDKDKDKENITPIIEDKNRSLVLDYRRKKNCASYNNIIINTEIDKNKNNNLNDIKKSEKFIKPEKKDEKKYNYENNRNYKSTSNIPIINKKDNASLNNNYNNNHNATTERNNNNLEKKKLLNFRKVRRKENNSNDDKSLNSPSASYILSPNNNSSTRVKRKMTYRSKRSNRNPQNENEIEKEEINNKKDDNKIDEDEKINKRKYIIKVTKTPSESNNHKSIENHGKTEDLNTNKKK
jgi:hypothetical protein